MGKGQRAKLARAGYSQSVAMGKNGRTMMSCQAASSRDRGQQLQELTGVNSNMEVPGHRSYVVFDCTGLKHMYLCIQKNFQSLSRTEKLW